MANSNRDVLLQVDVKTSSVIVAEGNFNFYITDKNTSNFYVQLMINQSQNPIISRYVILENAEEYSVILKCRKPNGELLDLEAEIVSAEESLFQFNLTQEHKNLVGVYLCELWIRSEVEDVEEIITTAPFKFTVLQSIINTYDNVVEDPQSYPILQDILNKIEEASLMNNATEEYVDEAIETVVEDMNITIEGINNAMADISESHAIDIEEIGVEIDEFKEDVVDTYTTKDEFKSASPTEGSVNLYVQRLAQKGYLNIEGGDVYPGDGTLNERYSHFIEVEEGMSYTYQLWYLTKDGTPWHSYQFYDADKIEVGERITFTEGVAQPNGLTYCTITFTVPLGVKYLRVSQRLYTGGLVKLEKGHIATPYTASPQDVLLPPGPNNWWSNSTPIVNSDGFMEIGKYIDFHISNGGTEDYSTRLEAANGSLYLEGGFHPEYTNTYTLGWADYRWKGLYLNANPNVSSDRTLKENIEYIKNEKAKSVPTDEIVTYEDMYDFVKNDLELAIYNFKGQEEQCMNFIAQDLLCNIDGTDNKVGQMIIKPVTPPTEEEIAEAKSKLEEGQEYTYPTLSYDMGMYISVLAGALKTALNKIDSLERRISELEG